MMLTTETKCAPLTSVFSSIISPCYRKYTGTGGYGEERRYGGGGSGAWGNGIQIEDQSFEHKDNNALVVRITVWQTAQT